jgi:hypothetical protein
LSITIDTIWRGDAVLRAHYNAHLEQPTLPGLPAHRPALPQYSFIADDAAAAKTSRTVPQERDAAGQPIAAGAHNAPNGAGGDDNIEDGQKVDTGQDDATRDEGTEGGGNNGSGSGGGGGGGNGRAGGGHSPSRPLNSYPFDFWPSLPWKNTPVADPTVRTAEHGSRITGEDIANHVPYTNAWIGTKPFLRDTAGEDDWDGAKFLGAGSSGSAGLWCRIDDNDNIAQVRVRWLAISSL